MLLLVFVAEQEYLDIQYFVTTAELVQEIPVRKNRPDLGDMDPTPWLRIHGSGLYYVNYADFCTVTEN